MDCATYIQSIVCSNPLIPFVEARCAVYLHIAVGDEVGVLEDPNVLLRPDVITLYYSRRGVQGDGQPLKVHSVLRGGNR